MAIDTINLVSRFIFLLADHTDTINGTPKNGQYTLLALAVVKNRRKIKVKIRKMIEGCRFKIKSMARKIKRKIKEAVS